MDGFPSSESPNFHGAPIFRGYVRFGEGKYFTNLDIPKIAGFFSFPPLPVNGEIGRKNFDQTNVSPNKNWLARNVGE